MKQTKRYALQDSALYKCTTKKKLASLLKTETNIILDPKLMSYRSWQEPKKGGGFRTLNSPNYQLKCIQRRVYRLLSPCIRPNWVVGGEKGKSHVDNSRVHQHSKYFLLKDIKGFYDHCTRENVYQFFRQEVKAAPDVAEILANLTTVNGTILQGFPTSLILTYYAYRAMFQEIFEAAERHGCKFTLFVDDMTFSSKEPFDHSALSYDANRILKKYGHSSKVGKTRYRGADKAKSVTGVIVSSDSQLQVPNKLHHEISKSFHQLKIWSKDRSLVCDNTFEKLRNRTLGQINSIHSIEPTKFGGMKQAIISMNKGA